MDADRLAASAAAWTAAWRHGNAHPAVVRAALAHLAATASGAEAVAAVARARAGLAAVPYGSVRPTAA
jgi:hypothetical protein